MDPILTILSVYGACFMVFGIWSFCAIAGDKSAAETRQWRTSECKLHFLELIGGWFGSITAQVCYHHKTKKLGYQFVFWIIATAHIVGIYLIWHNRNEIREYFDYKG